MYALISWNSQNGVPIGREELEVRATRTLTVMNGGKIEPGATVNLHYKKDIWGGTIQSLHDSKDEAEKQLDREVEGGDDSTVVDVCESSTNNVQRKRKKRSFGKDFEENNDSEESDDSRENERKKSKQVPNGPRGKENKKRRKVSPAEKERELTICSQHDELVITEILGPNPSNVKTAPAHPHFGGKQPKQHQPPKCISAMCKEEKERLSGQLRDTTQELEDMRKELSDARRELEQVQSESRRLKTLQPSTAVDSAKYGKVPRSVGIAKNWEEISDGVWCCPIKVKAAVKDAATRTALACALFGIFYPKEELKGRRLHELDRDVVEAITDFSMVAKLTKEPSSKNLKEGETPQPPSLVSRSTIKQAMRMKCNTIISLQHKKAESNSTS